MSRVPYDLTDKVVLITGGNGGIGAATARALLDRGAKVRIADIDPATPARADGLHPINTRVRRRRPRPSLPRGRVAQTVDRFGRLDVVIANAGLLAKAAALRNTPTAGIVDGLETRAARVIRPNLWRPVSSLRGLIGPTLDSRFAQDRRILDVLARLDARPPASPVLTPAAPSRRKQS